MKPLHQLMIASPEAVERAGEDRQRLICRETETFFMHRCLEVYQNGRQGRWQRDYTSPKDYLVSIESNRRRWAELLGAYEAADSDFRPQKEPFYEDDDVEIVCLSLQISDELRGRALLARPKKHDGQLPLVICQHGYSSTPENCFGLLDPKDAFHSFAWRLVHAGYAVLAPYNVRMGKPRGRFHRYASLIGKTLFGLEAFRLRRFIDYFEMAPEIDANRIAMWGLSLGGTATIFTAALETRIKVAVIAGWFNDRLKRMIIEDYRRASYLVEDVAEHLYLHGWMSEFGDCDLVSLICPRAVLIQAGKCDSSVWWPDAVEEFGRAREHFERLGIPDRCQLALHEGGHEVHLESGISFIETYL